MAASVAEATWSSPRSKQGGWEDVEDSKLMLELMLSSVDRTTIPPNSSPTADQLETLDLLGSTAASCMNAVEFSVSPPLLAASDALDLNLPLPPGWQKCLDLQTGRVYYLHNNGSSSTLGVPDKRLLDGFVPCPSSSFAHEVHPAANLIPNMKQVISPSPMLVPRAVCMPEGGEAPYRTTTTTATVFGVDLSSPPLRVELTSRHASSDSHTRSQGKGRGSAVAEMTTVGCANCLMFVMLSVRDPRCPNCGSCTILEFSQPPLAKRAKQT